MFTNKSVIVGLWVYLLLVLAGPVLKLAHVGPVAQWSWWWVTGMLWGPWVLSSAAGGFLLLRWLLFGPIRY